MAVPRGNGSSAEVGGGSDCRYKVNARQLAVLRRLVRHLEVVRAYSARRLRGLMLLPREVHCHPRPSPCCDAALLCDRRAFPRVLVEPASPWSKETRRSGFFEMKSLSNRRCKESPGLRYCPPGRPPQQVSARRTFQRASVSDRSAQQRRHGKWELIAKGSALTGSKRDEVCPMSNGTGHWGLPGGCSMVTGPRCVLHHLVRRDRRANPWSF